MSNDITALIAIRVITEPNDAAFDRAVEYYATLLAQQPRGDNGSPQPVRHARFDIDGIELVVAKEPDVTHEADGVRQGPAWLCFATVDPDNTYERVTTAGVPISGQLTDTTSDACVLRQRPGRPRDLRRNGLAQEVADAASVKSTRV